MCSIQFRLEVFVFPSAAQSLKYCNRGQQHCNLGRVFIYTCNIAYFIVLEVHRIGVKKNGVLREKFNLREKKCLLKGKHGFTRHEVCRGNKGKASLILSLYTRWRWLINFDFLPLYLRYPLNERGWRIGCVSNFVLCTAYSVPLKSEDIKRDVNGCTCSIHFSVRDKGRTRFVI